jgi:hypothetical protein
VAAPFRQEQQRDITESLSADTSSCRFWDHPAIAVFTSINSGLAVAVIMNLWYKGRAFAKPSITFYRNQKDKNR